MINYILQVVLFQVLFLAFYDFFLSKETFFTKNRWYLLCTPILSFLIPLIKIPMFQKAVPQEFIVYLPEIFLSPEKVIEKSIESTTFYESINYISILFWVGVVFFSILFFIKLVKIINLIRKSQVVKQADFRLILIPNETKAFSFFNYVFLGNEIEATKREEIIQHELVHSKQKHSVDLLFFEILKIIMWFNPMIYFYQKRITLVHEYISDSIVAKSETKERYINNLLSNFFQVENIAFINQFYKQTLIKKRIIMMTKNKSKKMNQLKYLVLVPVLVSMLFYISCSENFSEEISAKKELQTRYFEMSNGVKESKSKQKTYTDFYFGTGTPEGKEVAYDDLNTFEREEFDMLYDKIKNGSDNYFKNSLALKIYKKKNGRKTLASIFNSKKIEKAKRISKQSRNENGELTEIEEISFMIIDKAPTYPGCESGDKNCFSKSIQKHFSKNFNTNLPNQLGLTPGKKRIFIGFKIDKEGNVTDINARAPHLDLKNEVIKVMETLPKMIPGEHKGEKIGVKYSVPFTIIVE